MPADQVDTFMGVIRAIESGGGNPRGNYSAVNRSSGARGAYQIMPQYWDDWARMAGVPGADWRDPKMQDIVARHRMLSLYRKYGRWDYVAGAWFAGEGGLNSHLNGSKDPSDGNMRLTEYINKASSLMQRMSGAQAGSRAVSRGASGAEHLGLPSSPDSPLPAIKMGDGDAATFTPNINRDSEIRVEGAGRMFSDSDQLLPNRPANTSRGDLLETMLASVSSRLRSRQQDDQSIAEQLGEEGANDPNALPTTEAPPPEDTLLNEGEGDDPFARDRGVGGAIADAGAQLVGTGIASSLGSLSESDAVSNLPPLPDAMSPEDRAAMGESVQDAATFSRGSEILNIGNKFLGTPYVWGGDTPGGFDCSGLVQYVFKQAGIDLPRFSGDQAKAGTAVNSLDEAIPGDLVFWRGENGRPNHIGIYAGNGTMLEAPRTGLNVRYRKVGKTPDAIRRVL